MTVSYTGHSDGPGAAGRSGLVTGDRQPLEGHLIMPRVAHPGGGATLEVKGRAVSLIDCLRGMSLRNRDG